MADPIPPLRGAPVPLAPALPPAPSPAPPPRPPPTLAPSSLRSALIQRATSGGSAAATAASTVLASARIQAGLQAFLASARVTVTTPSGTISVPIGFRMVQRDRIIEPPPPRKQVVEAALRSAGLTAFGGQILSGRGQVAQIQAVVQALVDMGELSRAPGATDAQKLRNMMFAFNIGLDCTGYVAPAFLTTMGLTRAQAGLVAPVDETLGALRPPHFVRVRLAGTRPGDILCFGPPPRGTVGHRAILYAVHPATGTDLARFNREIALHNQDPHSVQDFPHPIGNVTTYEVDSSWGNYGEGALGGIERVLLMHDERSGVWVTAKSDNSIVSYLPYDHPLEGIARWVR